MMVQSQVLGVLAGCCVASPAIKWQTGRRCCCCMCMQDGYDHSYFFMATFMEDHLDFHAKYLKA